MTQPRQTHRPPLQQVLEAYVAVTGASYTAKAGDRVVGVNRDGAVTITLPTGQIRPGRIYTIKDESGAASSNNITVATEGHETIDGSATDVINVNYECKSYYSDGSNWFILPVAPITSAQVSFDAPGLTLSTSNVEGAGNSIRSGATIALFDATDPSTQAHGDSAAAGNAAVAARRDHKHAMPSAGGGADISARVTHGSNQSIANATDTVLAFSTEDFDTDNIHDNSTDNSRLRAATAGKYIITGSLSWAANAIGTRKIWIRLNGTAKVAESNTNAAGSGESADSIAMILDLNATDYVELVVRQTSGGALNVTGTAWGPVFAMAKIMG